MSTSRILTVVHDTGDIITYDYDTGEVHSFPPTLPTFGFEEPAIRCCDGPNYYEIYFKQGKLHREEGPAFNKYGPYSQFEYWLDGVKLTPKEWVLKTSKSFRYE